MMLHAPDRAKRLRRFPPASGCRGRRGKRRHPWEQARRLVVVAASRQCRAPLRRATCHAHSPWLVGGFHGRGMPKDMAALAAATLRASAPGCPVLAPYPYPSTRRPAGPVCLPSRLPVRALPPPCAATRVLAVDRICMHLRVSASLPLLVGSDSFVLDVSLGSRSS